MSEFLTNQIMTYMGNKRKFLPYIDDIIVSIEKELNKKLTIGEGFSGTGIVSRLFKTKASQLYVNDIASYSKTLNCCYLSNITKKDYHRIKILINQINTLVNKIKVQSTHHLFLNIGHLKMMKI